MQRKLLYNDQKAQLLRMLPYALPGLLISLGNAFGSYGTLFQQLHGFSTQTIGTVSGVGSLMVVFGEIIFSRLSDKMRSVKKIAILATFLSALIIVAIPLSTKCSFAGGKMVLIVLMVSGLFTTPCNTLLENWALRASYEQRFDYGLTRSFNSIGALGGSFLSSLVLIWICSLVGQKEGVGYTYIIDAVFYVLTILTFLRLKDAKPSEKENVSKKELNPKRLFSNFYYTALVLFYFLSCAFVNPPALFMSVLMTERELNAERLGIILGLQAMFQLPVLFLFSFLSRHVKMRPLVMAGTACYAISALINSTATTFFQLVIATVFFGFAGGLIGGASSTYIYQLAPPELRASAHAYFVVFGSLGVFVGNVISGYAIAAWGVQKFYVLFGIFIAATVALYFVVVLLKRLIRPDREDEEAPCW